MIRRLAAIAVVLLLSAPALAATPGTLAIEGVLTSGGGGPAADGKYKLTFAIYPSATASSAAWSEGPIDVQVTAGRFSAAIGKSKPLSDAALAGLKTPWLGVKVGSDPELPRSPLHAVAYARVAARADTLACTGCIKAGQIANGGISAAKVGFTYAGSASKGGPAKDLSCTGCVSTKEMKFDGDVDLGGNSLKAKNGTFTGDLAAGTVTATSFVGDGSKLTGLKTPAGECKKAGEVVKGINADGSLKCVAAMDPSALPANGIDEISNGLIHNQFADTVITSMTGVPIPDNTGSEAVSNISFPDLGIAEDISVTIKVENTDLSKVSLTLLPPNDKKQGYVMCDPCGGKDVKVLNKTWTVKVKPKSGDLGTWIGKNPKGLWNLKAKDTSYCVVQAPGNAKYCNTTKKTDGWIGTWSISTKTLSSKKVQVKGNLVVSGSVQFGNDTAPCSKTNAGAIRWTGTVFQGCNGNVWTGLQGPDGNSKAAAAQSCKNIKAAYPLSPDGTYWVDPNGGNTNDAFQVICDMTSQGGGWTLVMNLDTNDSGHRHYFDTNFWTKAGQYYGGLTSAQTADYKGAAYDKVEASEIMIEAHVEGSQKGTARYALQGSWAKRTFAYLFSKTNNTTVTGNRVASTGSIGTFGRARNAGDSFIDHAEPLIFNSRYYRSSNDDYTRIGTNYGAYCGTINCNGHNFSGLGGRHHHSGWGAYYEAAQINGYCSTQGVYGTNHSKYSSSDAGDGCSYKAADMDFALWVR